MSDASYIDRPLIRRRWVRWLVILGVYLLVGLYFALQNVLAPITQGQPVPWDRAVVSELVYWFIWAILTPFILWYARRFRIERGQWKRGLLAHGVLSVLVAPAQEVCWRLFLYLVIAGRSGAEVVAAWPEWRGNWLIGSLTSFYKYWLIVGIYYTFDYYRKYRHREREALDLQLRTAQLEAQLTSAQLQALKMQLHPHFLFNTLNAVSVLMNAGEVEAANQMLLRLSDLLRVTLDNVGAEEVSLKQELDFLQRYLEIEQIRFQDRLTIRLEIDPATLDAQVPNLILQPLVENAVRHGISGRKAPGTILIRSTRREGQLQLEVHDDGPGLEDGMLEEGVGLSNTRERLRQHYGGAHRFELGEAEEGGLRVSMTIPFQTE